MKGDQYSVLPLLLLKKFGISGGRGLNQWLRGEPGVGEHPGRTCLWMECFKESGLEVVQNKGLLCKNNTRKTPQLHCHNVVSTCTDQENTSDAHRYYILWIKIKKYTSTVYTVYAYCIALHTVILWSKAQEDTAAQRDVLRGGYTQWPVNFPITIFYFIIINISHVWLKEQKICFSQVPGWMCCEDYNNLKNPTLGPKNLS